MRLGTLSAVALSVGLAMAITAARADDGDICGNENASDATRLAACGRVIAAYRPSNSGSAAAAEKYNGVQLARLSRIDIYDRQGKYDLALRDADAAIRLGVSDPLVVFFHNSRTDILLKTGDYDRALSGLTSAIARKPSYAAVLHQNRAEVWSTKGDIDRAISDMSEAIRLQPTEGFFFVNRAQYWVARKDREKALSDFTEAVRLGPAVAGIFTNRAAFWRDGGDFEKSFADFAEALRIDPRNADAYNGRALVWRDLGDYDKALSDYDEAIKINAKGTTAIANRGEIWRLKGDLDRALADQTEALRIDPRNGVALILRGDTYRYRGEAMRAIADYNEALRQSPTNIISVATGRGLAYEKLGDLGKARAEFAIAVKSGTGRGLVDIDRSRFDTAQAHIAAIDSGTPPPSIAAAPIKVTSGTSIPTPAGLIVPAAPVVAAPSAQQATAGPQQIAPEVKQGRRVALVIGNSAYRNVPALANPQKDADAIAASLRNIGFESVTLVSDTTREALINALRAFANEAENSDWAMVYYAGHGIEVGGVNYLVPVDAKLAVDRDIEFEAVALNQVLNATGAAKKIKLVMLDACRDNPFTPRKTERQEVVASNSTAGMTIASRSTNGRGLAEVKVQGATLVVYAAKDGQVALDGEGGNSPFAIAVVQRIATPGVEINKIFRLVRDDVMEATAGRQEPFTYGSLPGREDFFFVAK